MSSLKVQTRRARVVSILLVVLFVSALATTYCAAAAQGPSGSVRGTVKDPTGAVVQGATVEISNPVSGHEQTTVSGNDGTFQFANVPFNNYHVSVKALGFAPASMDINVRSAVTVEADVSLQVTAGQQTVTVEATSEDLLENTPTTHTDVDRSLIEKLPTESTNSSLSSLITLATPGIAADSNGFFHPLGEHMEQQFSLDGQPITDQQARYFSNPPPVSAIDSMEVIDGIPPAEFGDKQSVVVRTVTRSGLNLPRPTGSVSTSYGSFGTSNLNLALGLGGKSFGNFFTADGVNSGRFLDTPEFQPLHAHGNAENFFDRLDYQLGPNDNFHLNLLAQRSWFQVPNQFDQQALGQDQRQQIKSFNIAPAYTHVFNNQSLASIQAWVRQDRIAFYPSADPFSDSPATLASGRRLTSTGAKVDYSYVKGHHNAKFGVQIQHTFLSEDFALGLTDATFNAPCLDPNGNPITDPTVLPPCSGAGQAANPGFLPGLLPYDLTRGGSLFHFLGRTDIKEESVYGQDAVTMGSLVASFGLRFDNYNGLSSRYQFEPRTGLSYAVKRTGTVLRLGYGREMVTPFNEFLVLSSSTGAGGLAQNVFGSFGATPLEPGTRNHFTAGFQQAFGKWVMVDADYFWKFTHRDYDFDVLFSTPLTFPIQWYKSKIDGLAVRVSMPQTHGLSAYSVFGHARSRFFNPEVGGILFNSPVTSGVFRIDHDQAFQQTTHLQYQPKPRLPWLAFTWRFDSGLVAGAITDPATALSITPDQQGQIGLFCGANFASYNNPITSCPAGVPLGATRVNIPASGTENDDHNPPRVASRNLFDMGAGWDNIFHKDHYKTNLTFTVVNLTNKESLYNVLSTFSGTHFVGPRTYSAQVGVSF